MDSTQPMGSLIGFDAATANVNRGRRSTDRVDGSAFAQVFDLAAYRMTGSRDAARVAAPAPLQAVPAAAAPAGLSVAHSAPAAVLADLDRAAADRLYLHLTTGGSWIKMTDEGSGTVRMRLHGANGEPVRELSITELGGDGPEVA